jgi:hypothetical protein
MHRIILSIRIFFLTLFKSAIAGQVDKLLVGAQTPPSAVPGTTPPQAKQTPPPTPKATVRSDAIALLATLQREARLVDFIQESLSGYSDAQIGAAVRDVDRDSAAVIQRLFALKPAAAQEEGSDVELPKGFDAGRFRLTGNVSGEPPLKGKLVHPGWEATKCELPTWTGSKDAARVIAPAEVEIK